MRRVLFASALAVALGSAGGRAAQAPVEFASKVNGATSVSVGDRVVVTYSARIPAGATLSLESLVTPAPDGGERPPGGAVLEFEAPGRPTITKSTTGDFFEWSQAVALFPFQAGAIRVPGPHYSFKENFPSPSSSPIDVRPPDLTLNVASRLPKDQKPEQLAPKDDKAIRLPAIPAKFWIALGAAVALVAGLVWWWVVRRRRRAGAGAPAAPVVALAEELGRELDRLAALVDGLGEDARPFYTDLTHAVKRYLERTTGDPVLEWTTFETVRRFREQGFDFPREVAFPDLLAAADHVKFGKGAATRDTARDALDRARRLRVHVEAREAARREAEAAREKSREKAS